MDNDTLRRGKPSTHIKFGESTAILAGNSLLTLAFEIIADKKFNVDTTVKLNLIKKLSECAGHVGIAGGQFLDLNYEKKKINFKKIINMQRKKTGKLFEFCCLAPAIIAKKSIKTQKEMSKVGAELGLLFQIADDLLDIKGNKKNTGKPVKKDKKKGKSTLIKLFGYEKTLGFALDRKKMIINKLKKYGKKSNKLIEVSDFILNRSF
jgi:farnesyl diphosphate synthase